MGLFINKENKNIYKNTQDIKAANQEEARQNPITEFIRKQETANKQLLKSIAEMQPHYDHLQEYQTAQWKEIKGQIRRLKGQGKKREDFERQMMDHVNQLDETAKFNSNALLENEKLIKSVMERIDTISEANKGIAERLGESEASNRQFSEQLSEQLILQKEAAGQLAKHEEFQIEVLKRMDKQEALTDKIFHHLNNIRSILFERTNFLAAKIEEGYTLTSSYVYKLMTGSDQPISFSLLYNKKKKEPKNNEL